MKAISKILSFALLGLMTCRTIFEAKSSADHAIYRIVANDGKPLKITDKDGHQYGSLKATRELEMGEGYWYYIKFDSDVNENASSKEEYNQDFATFFGKDYKYDGNEYYGELPLWKSDSQDQPKEAELKKNLSKLKGNFIRIVDDKLIFLE
jgi:hypothetical protein